jgi:RimJ/RimL family protein N-acetyltransferase
MMVGHAGFHLPPQPLTEAMADASFQGTCEPTPGGVVEVGYTVFPDYRRLGYASEAIACLVRWAFDTGDVTSVLATLAPDNVASLRVLDRVGGFRQVGTCRDASAGEEIVFRRDLYGAKRDCLSFTTPETRAFPNSSPGRGDASSPWLRRRVLLDPLSSQS